MNETNESVKISVRTLVEFLLRSGDITVGGSGVKNVDAMLEGSRIHRKIQRSMGPGYESEVPLSTYIDITSKESGGFRLIVEGRADGIYRPDEDGPVIVDEIKGVYANIDEFKEPEPVHLAQAKCYAYMITEAEGLDEIAVQITYCNLENERIRRFKTTHTTSDIKKWFDELIDMYKPWAIYSYDHQKIRNASIQSLMFPFEYRKGQDDLCAYTYQRIVQGGDLFIEAPTGVGKTITTVFPAVKSMGEGISERIFYLTAKTITRTVAWDCFSLLSEHGLIFKPIILTAKEKMCILDRPNCDPTQCERAKGHLDRVNDALYDLLINEDRMDRDTINAYAEKHCVCPFELSLDATLFADAIICDYNYVFDPNVYLRRFFGAGKKTANLLLTDEAHNLVERGRQMYSATIIKEDFLKIGRILKKMKKVEARKDASYAIGEMIKAVDATNRSLLSYKRMSEGFTELDDVGGLYYKLLRVAADYELMAGEVEALPERETFLDFYFSVRSFIATWEVYDDHYRTYADYSDEGEFRITLQCMDPSRLLNEVCEKMKASVFFSATLLPIRYYKEQLGGTEDDPAVYAPSSFSPDQRRIIIAKDVTSKYTKRGPKMYERIAHYIEKTVAAKSGNYMVFFPSYPFMEKVSEYLSLPDEITILTQDRHMKEEKREEFLSQFENDNVVGLCVMGGIFAEGIDLQGEKLIGAIIVGTGLPMVCDEREFFKKYFDGANGRGFDYAYLYPGLGKVFQAAGRVIRTATDRGIVLLLDDRFLKNEYRSNFPREWSKYHTVTLDTVADELSEFWDEN